MIRWLAPILLTGLMASLLVGCGKDKTVNPTATKDEMEVRADTAWAGLSDQDLRFRAGVFETYLRLRDGIPPSQDPQEKKRVFSAYLNSWNEVLSANKNLVNNPSAQCRRFITLYENIGNSLARGYARLLDESTDEELRTHLRARLQTLDLFESTLFSLILYGAEGGYSEIDRSQRYRCAVIDREAWENAYFRARRDQSLAQIAFFGVESMAVPTTKTADFSVVNDQYEVAQKSKKFGFILSEIVASIVLWSKAIGPRLEGWLRKFGHKTKVGRLLRLATNVAYVTGWVALDRQLRTRVDFLADQTSIIQDTSTISSWERTMRLGEAVVEADVVSPPVYYAYLRLISSLERQRALDFLTVNEWVLVDAEERFGSVDAALENLKEVAGL